MNIKGILFRRDRKREDGKQRRQKRQKIRGGMEWKKEGDKLGE